MKRQFYLMVSAVLVGGNAVAEQDFDQLQSLAQQEFRLLSEDFGAALSYKAVAPAEPLGVTGFDVGLEVTATHLAHNKIWQEASSGNELLSYLYVPKIHVHKGLPMNFDIAGFYSSVPTTNINLWGAEVRYSILEGSTAIPAVAVRGTFSVLSGIDQLDFNTKGLELSISKGFLMLTPYAGIGQYWVTSTPKGSATDVLAEESFSETKYFVGANFNLALINMDVEADRSGGINTYSAKVGWRF